MRRIAAALFAIGLTALIAAGINHTFHGFGNFFVLVSTSIINTALLLFYVDNFGAGWTIYGAMTNYILINATFASLYRAIQSQFPGAFNDYLSRLDAVYFSVSTLTTAGYGDITPKIWQSKLAVTVELSIGILYDLTVFSLVSAVVVQRFLKR